ncbi:TROVE domain-containing protein [Paraliomyxa miuraensis]|uniref:TROVE domain-containing protein n=1 Tax=Paraliomyxa miuraensis TaxID=376150 RepID=UPI0022572EDF|nr:TROVE domain-containing protein [Paraliomyxa miuraensis]MCX4241221.1 TROVE domain-containing protein [Paraliomyxa miuraensis]
MALFHRSKRLEHDDRAKANLDCHRNWMNGTSYAITDPLLRLRMAAASCFFGEPMYYHRDGADRRARRRAPAFALTDADVTRLREMLGAVDPQDWRGLSPAELIERTVDEALGHDAEATLAEAVRLRHEAFIRTTPQVILVRAANHAAVKGTGLVRRFGPRIIARADEPAVGLAYQLHRFGKPIPNALKKAWRDALQRFPAHALAKYRMQTRTERTVDVVNLVHPKSMAVDELAKGTLTNDERTWESIVSTHGSTHEAWTRALPVMGHMALLRNLRNLMQAGIPAQQVASALMAGARTGKQLPFRYYSAYQALGSDAPAALKDAVEDCLMTSLDNLPWFGGRTMALCDSSGSAQGTTTSAMGTMKVSTIANLTAVLAAMRSDEGHVGVFGDRLKTMSIRKRSSVFDRLDAAEHAAKDIGLGTENGIWLFWDRAIRQREHWDQVFVFSDMQAGHGGLYGTTPKAYRAYAWEGREQYIDVPKLVAKYRAEVNPDVRVFLVQVAGYQDALMPEHYRRTYILGGWGPGLLGYAAEMAALEQQAA